MSELSIIFASQNCEWEQTIKNADSYDFYHLPGYHTLHERQGDGTGTLLVYEEDNKFIALPLMIREISQIPGLETFTDYRDATSVYGYPGPICNAAARRDQSFIARFHQQLNRYALSQGWVSVFSRLNPLLKNHQLLTHHGEIIGLGDTIIIDLGLTEEEQTAQYRKSHRYEVRRARREGMKVHHDAEWKNYEAFIDLYHRTMQRVHAAPHYFFNRTYFDDLRTALGNRLRLYVATMNGNFCAASLFVKTQNIIEYHLSASSDDCLKWAPSKLIIDEVRQWGKVSGARWLHLGGGVGSQEDALFRFKAGFSPLRRRFFIWKWIVQPQVYEQLVRKREQWVRKHNESISDSSYFPSYRHP